MQISKSLVIQPWANLVQLTVRPCAAYGGGSSAFWHTSVLSVDSKEQFIIAVKFKPAPRWPRNAVLGAQRQTFLQRQGDKNSSPCCSLSSPMTLDNWKERFHSCRNTACGVEKTQPGQCCTRQEDRRQVFQTKMAREWSTAIYQTHTAPEGTLLIN